MGFKETAFWKWWKEYGKHIEALIIIIFLFSVWFAYSSNNRLQKEINEKCGWETEKYRCVCDKDNVLRLDPLINKNEKLNFSGIKNV